MPSPRHTPDRRLVLGVYAEDGLAEAHRRTGIPKPTILRWAHQVGVEPDTERSSDRSTQFAPCASVASVASRRPRANRLADDLMRVAEERTRDLRMRAATDEPATARFIAVAIDRAQQLARDSELRARPLWPHGRGVREAP